MAIKTKYKVGDIVQLRSWSPKMTVNCVPKDSLENDYYVCVWFDHNHNFKEKKFKEGALELVKPDEK